MEKVIQECRDIFKRHSVTYYYSTLIFPKEIRYKVFILYAFVRLADEFVDNPLPGVDPSSSLLDFRTIFENEWTDGNGDNSVVTAFVQLAKSHQFEKAWVDAFFDSMGMDLTKTRYATFAELETYIYGSAEVIGLMMSHIMGLDPSHDLEARALGSSMQLINFLRDIREDYERGRIYFPLNELQQHNLSEENWISDNITTDHVLFVHSQISRILDIHHRAKKGIEIMPFRAKKAVTLASEGYLHTLHKIAALPKTPFLRTLSNRKRDILHVFIRSILHP